MTSSIDSAQRPAIGDTVVYMTSEGSGLSSRAGIVVGYPSYETHAVHLAILDGDELDYLAMAVPESDNKQAGTWHRCPSSDDTAAALDEVLDRAVENEEQTGGSADE